MENDFNIIPLVKDDNIVKYIEQIAKIQKLENNVLIAKEKLEEEIKDSSYYYITAIKDGKVLGFASMSILVDHSDINNIFVSLENRCHGIGTSLLQSLIIKSKELNLESIFLEVSENNKDAIRLYEENGFKYIDTRKGYYISTGKDALIYCMKLN